jgi:hypothetical protein
VQVEVHAVAWNERYLLPHWVRHYREFCSKLVIHDNGSNDGTPELAKQLGCEVRTYDTAGEQDNLAMQMLKSNCWKGTPADWVIVCDMDEFLTGWERLEALDPDRFTVLQVTGWNIVTESPPKDFAIPLRGMRAHHMDKPLCFSPRVGEINYAVGCHTCSPANGQVCPNILGMYHLCFLGEQYTVNRWKRYVPRMSARDKAQGWGAHYLDPEDQIRAMWRHSMESAVDLPQLYYNREEPSCLSSLRIGGQDVTEVDSVFYSGSRQ